MSAALSALVEVLGEDGALQLIEAFGGTRIIVPARRPGKHKLLEVLGAERFQALWDRFKGEVFCVPIERSWRIKIYAQRGLSRAEIARRTGCEENTVYKHLRGDKRVSGQLTLAFEK